MTAALAQIASIAVVVFAVSSLLSVGLAYRLRAIVAPLRNVRSVFRALVANFALVPLLAVGLERMFALEPAHALGLFLLAGSAGAPFLIKLASTARSDLALSASLLVLLIPATVVFLPFYVPLAMAHPTFRGLDYVPSSIFEIGVPLLTTLILPLGIGLLIHAVLPRSSTRLARIGGKVSTASLLVVVVATFGANFRSLLVIVTNEAIVAGVALILGAFVIGYLLSRRDRSAVLGLGTAQRNIAGAMVIATQDFNDPDILMMVVASELAGLLVLFPLASLLSRRTVKIGLPMPRAAPA